MRRVRSILVLRMNSSMKPKEVAAQEISSPEVFLREIAEPCQPVVLRGLVGSWPAKRAADRSPLELKNYLSRFDAGAETEVFIGQPDIAGKYYYSDDLKGFNFSRSRMTLADALESVVSTVDRPRQPSMYVGSLPTEHYLPGFATQNALPILDAGIAPRIWFGHASNVSAHYDTFDNVACVVAGRRRFTLFAPQTIDRLYVGPLDHNMAGQPVSLAAAAAPDDARFPRFREVRDQALVAELDAGDAIYLPKLWWHQVQAISAFNVLVNYWWDAFAIGPDAPSIGLLLSMITIAERPRAEREAWKAFFDHYVFRSQGHPLAHLPATEHGVLGPLREGNYEKIRARVMHLLRGR
jgi:cupin-like protein